MISCTIASKIGTDRFDNLRAVALPARSGELQVLSGHAETFMLLREGDIVLDFADGTAKKIPVADGGAYVKNDAVLVLIASAGDGAEAKAAPKKK